VLPTHKANAHTPYCKPAQPEMATPYLASGLPTLHFSRSDSTGKIITKKLHHQKIKHTFAKNFEVWRQA
jgi:hypothetical protein